jgi:nucleoside-diphosphate-sugar epimerase
MSILVTGGKGLIGSRIIKKLVDRDERVVCLDLKTTPGRLGDTAKKIEMITGDLTTVDSLVDNVRTHDIDKIAHMVFFSAEERGVAERPERGGDLYKQIMVMNVSSFNVFEAARVAGVKRVLYPSSLGYHGPQPLQEGKPIPAHEESPSLFTSLYGIGKHLVETLAREYNRLLGTEIISVRIPAAYGPGVRIGARGVNLIPVQGGVGNPVVLPYKAEQRHCLAHVDDVAEIFVRLLLAKTVKHQVYQVGGHDISNAEMAEIGKELIPDMQISFEPKIRVNVHLVDNSRMREELGVEHRSVKDGFLEVINWARHEAGMQPLRETR